LNCDDTEVSSVHQNLMRIFLEGMW
jgi:hypothetical protein